MRAWPLAGFVNADGDVFDQVVFAFVEKEAGGHIDHDLTDEAFEPWGFEQRGKHKQRNRPPEVGKELREEGAEINHKLIRMG